MNRVKIICNDVNGIGHESLPIEGPLTCGQTELWMMENISRCKGANNLISIVKIKDGVDEHTLTRIMNQLIMRNPAWRSYFITKTGGLKQVVNPLPDARLSMISCEDWTCADYSAWLNNESFVPFDLSKGVFRSYFLKNCPYHTDHPAANLLIIMVHHIVADISSVDLYISELNRLYSDSEMSLTDCAGCSPNFIDFAEYENRLLHDADMDEHRSFWRKQLKDLNALEGVPADVKNKTASGLSYSTYHKKLPSELASNIRKLGMSLSATPYMTVVSAFFIFIYRYVNSEDVIVGSPVSIRPKEFKDVIGYYVNLVPLRLQLNCEDSYCDVLSKIKENLHSAMKFKNLPFAEIVKEINQDASTSRNAFFHAMFAWERIKKTSKKQTKDHVDPLVIESISSHQSGTNQDLSISFYDDSTDLALIWHFDSGLFSRETIHHMTENLLTLMDAIVHDPKSPISHLPLLAPSDLYCVTHKFNETKRNHHLNRCIHELFEEQAAKTPKRTALVYDGKSLSYEELNRKANNLAHHLRSLGVKPDFLVAVCAERNLEVLVGILGVLKAGGAYVPLDPVYPAERLKQILQDCGARVLLTPGPLIPALAEGLKENMVVVDLNGGFQGSDGNREPASISLNARHLAYVIYTSGSTGTPKGVMVEHSSVVNLLEDWNARNAGFGATSPFNTSLWTRFSFDVSVFEIFVALTTGGTAHLVPEPIRADAAALIEWYAKHRIAFAYLPPFFVRWLKGYLEKGHRDIPFKWLLLGVEPLMESDLYHLQAACPGLRIINGYGPTETTVFSTAYGEIKNEARFAPIGSPIANTQVYILDVNSQLVPPGATGELYIGGAGLARGYLNRPGLTAERFIANPFGEGRLYRTGDLGRWCLDGQIEFIGRNDFQVKVRGFRIELGEIEAKLLEYAGVREAAVIAWEDVPGEKRLVAYLVTDNLKDSADIKIHIAACLPEYMVPSAFVFLDSLPLTPNGKLDRKALPAPNSHAEGRAAYERPEGSVETALASLWSSLLKVDKVGIHDNFFDLGGHSLLMVSLKDLIQQEMGIEIPLVELYRLPTIGRQAAFLQGLDESLEKPEICAPRIAIQGGIAIIGIAGRFPGADTVENFWQGLCDGKECIRFFSREELSEAGIAPAFLDNPEYVPAHGILQDIERFDAAFFGISAREAEIIDPQQRLLLEEAWHAFEDAGYDPARLQDRVGVFVGTSTSNYLMENVLPQSDLVESLGKMAVMLGNDKDFAATRISYKLGLRGPSLTVNTACSTSLVAIHQAVTALQSGQCEMALAGGACVRSRQISGYLYEQAGILSRDGKCRAFDAESSGTVGGNGVALVLLKPLETALADGDHIHAVIKGVAINNDGPDKVGYTAPSIQGQSKVIRDALKRAGVDPLTVSYTETHGTGTRLGDSIEVAALAENYAPGGKRSIPMYLGAVKSNIGHLDAASGVTGLIKAALCLRERTLVPTLHFSTPNPQVPWPGSCFSVCTQTQAFPPAFTPLRAAVSSFGLGGTNVHAILEEAPPRQAGSNATSQVLLLLSGKTPRALEANALALANWFERNPEASIMDVAYTLALGRRAWECRRTLSVKSAHDAGIRLCEKIPFVDPADAIAFLFPDRVQGSADMACALYGISPVFRACMDECADLLQPSLGLDIRDVLLNASDCGAGNPMPEGSPGVVPPGNYQVQQSVGFVVEYALALFWRDLGIHPVALYGHGQGEWVAACLAGVFTLPDALRLVALRGALLDGIQRDELTDGIQGGALLSEADRQESFRLAVAATRRHMPDPAMAIFSISTGKYLETESLHSPDYWVRQMDNSVCAEDPLASLWERPGLALLECGPADILCECVLENSDRPDTRPILGGFKTGEQKDALWRWVLDSAGALWAAGLPLDLGHFFAMMGKGQRIPIPGYAFQRRRFWLEAPDLPCQTIEEPRNISVVMESDNTLSQNEAPVGPIECAVAAVWSELLKAENISRFDNFLLLGGNSLLSLRVISRLRRMLGIEVPFIDTFAHPVLADFAKSIANAVNVELSAIIPCDRKLPVPLSSAQQRMWFLAQFEGASAAYHIPFCLRLRGALDRQALKKALDFIVARHEALRTTFVQLEGEPVQQIAPAGDSRFLLLEQVAHDDSVLQRLASEEAMTPFDLQHGPLVRGRLIQEAEELHSLLITMHHIVSDGWSLGVFYKELVALYGAATSQREPSLAPLEVQYADYTNWQRQWLSSDACKAQMEYWKNTLSGAPALLELPLDHQRPVQQDYAGDIVEFDLDPSLTARLKAFGLKHNATVFMTMLTAWAILLSRLSSQEDIVIGTPTANRRHREVEGLIGLFVNTLALRLDLSASPSVLALLERVKACCLEAQSNQDIPFEQVVETVSPARSLSHSPLFQVMFAWQSNAEMHLELPGLCLEELNQGPQKTSRFDLSISLQEAEGCISGSLEYATALFERESVDRYLACYRRILEGMVSDENQPVLRIPMLPEAQANQVLETFNRTKAQFPQNKCIHELFEEQVSKTPGAMALVFGEETLNYGELNAKANRLAHRLISMGVKPDSRVAICASRSLEMVIGLLGVLKAGGAYVPMDPSYPLERLQHILVDSEPMALLTDGKQEALKDIIPAGLMAVDIRQCLDQGPLHDPFILDSGLTPENIAYVIYTSGSTGKPKGVMVEHRGICNLVQAQIQGIDVRAESRVLQFASFSFDACVFEVVMALCRGASLIIPPADQPLVGNVLGDVIHKYAITHATLTPALLAALPEDADLSPLQTLVIAGDVLSEAIAKRWGKKLHVINAYGPTETTVWATMHRCNPEAMGNPPIGRPIANTQIYILDGALQPVPVGVSGEIHIGGAGVARGYLNRPELTVERFISNPFGEGRLYKTGDLGRWLPDGTIEFLGRNDFQVKIRGFRIELGEIEARLLEHPGINEAAVLAREDQAGDKRLVAYFTPNRSVADQAANPDQNLSVEALKAHLSSRLPEYMVPSVFVALENLPLTPNGKLDRKALPPPGRQAFASSEYVALEGEVENRLASIWAALLSVEKIGKNDNFFDLGGHSLLMVRLKDRIREELGAEISLLELYGLPTVARQAAFLQGRMAPSDRQEAPRKSQAQLGQHGEIAIIGMAGRFPGSDDIESFWQSLREGQEGIRIFTREELLEAGVPASMADHPDYVPACATLQGIDRFDAAFFGISAREAEIIDPQQRLLLEEAWHAFENAGYDPAQIQDRVGVFVGAGISRYMIENVLPYRELVENLGEMTVMLGSDKDYAATRISYKLDLRGPSMAVNTACSTSLVAIHQAVLALRDGQCEMALAGGTSVRPRQVTGYIYEQAGIASRDGKCRAFDADSSGTVGGSGVALVLLKPLEAAIADGDHIHAVIKGIAINNDGTNKVGFTAPSIQGQSGVIRDALHRSGVDPLSVSYVETHGTGTRLGDSIEVAALAENYAPGLNRSTPLYLGAVKSNIGHLDAASGATGLIKAALCLRERTLVPTLHFRSPNPQVPWPGESFCVCTRTEPFAPGSTPLRAAVSAFGLGGTNAHAILEEAPARTAGTGSPSQVLLLVSGKTPGALQANVAALVGFFEHRPETSLLDASYTLAFGRRAWEYRRAVCVANTAEAAALLSEHPPLGAQADAVAFLFTGMGQNKPGSARALYGVSPVFQACIDECADHLLPLLGVDVREILLAAPDSGRAHELLRDQRVGQPTQFALQYALAHFWMDLGIRPAVLIGHSLGEWVAACLAGVYTLPDVLRLVALRGGLADDIRGGAMTAVNLSEADVLSRLPKDIDIALINAVDQVVISGPAASVAAFTATLEEEGIRCKALQFFTAFHSSLLEPMLESFRSAVASTPRNAPNPDMAIVSNVTGTYLDAKSIQDPDYWVRHMRHCVRFTDGLETIWARPGLALLECGPTNTLCNLALRDPRRPDARPILSSLNGLEDPEAGWRCVLETAGSLWSAGIPLAMARLFSLLGKGRRIPLPGYIFQRKRFWLNAVDLPSTVMPLSTAPSEEADDENEMVEFEAPVGDIECAVAAVWSELLNVEKISRFDNFFALGGNSLLTVRVISRLRKILGIEVPFIDNFNYPVLCVFAKNIANAVGAQLSAITPCDRSQSLPLSFAQQRMWFLAQMEGGSAAYHIPIRLRWRGALNIDALQNALDSIISRHEALRTTFIQCDGEPVQCIAPAAGSRFPLLFQVADQPSTLARLIAEESASPFDLERGPLVRGRLIQEAENLHTLLITMHHIVSDGWSLGVFYRELSHVYSASLHGTTASLEPLEVQYADYAMWQRQWLRGEDFKKQADYWKKTLMDAPSLLELPVDRPRPMQQDYAGATVKFELDHLLTKKLDTFSTQNSATLFMTLLTGWAILLSRLSNQKDIVIGTPVANRRHREIEDLIGFFVNTLALRLDLSGSPSVVSLLERVKNRALEGQAEQDIPFEQVVEVVNPMRSMAHSPLFQVMFAWQNNESIELEMPGLHLDDLGVDDSKVARFDLELSMHEANDRIHGRLSYSTAIFEHESIVRMVDCFRVLLDCMVENDALPVDRLCLLPESQREQIVETWNGTESLFKDVRGIHELFEEQAANNPEAVALLHAGRSLTYGELNAEANRLAHHLRDLGVQPDSRVALCVNRGIGMITGILAILKAGGAYLPLDANYPAERLQTMLLDSKPVVLITESSLCGLLPEVAAHTLCLDLDAEAWREKADINPSWISTPDNLAYVIYTSGSTGKPKGVAMLHRALINLIQWQMDRSGCCGSLRTLQYSPISFDVSFQEIFATLGSGMVLVLVSEEIRRDASSLIRFLRDQHIQRIFLPYAALQQIADTAAYENFWPVGLREIITAGEQVKNTPSLRRLLEELPDCSLDNQYGPTETHVVTACKLPLSTKEWPELPPIGVPIANTQIYLLDGHMQPVPLGVAGEIYIGGTGLAQGYWGRPEITAERFVENPFAEGRLYKTGDLGRWQPDGAIAFLGRNDFQIKLRGFRIELGEIEARLMEYPGVREAAVAASGDQSGEKRLVAYFTSVETPGSEALRAHLSGLLPEYMIPVAFVHMDALPLTPNGKVNYKALPAPDADAFATRKYEAPQDDVECKVAAIWSELLGLERVGRCDDFFALGGHSLLTVRVASRLRKTFDIEISISDIFANPTLLALAAMIRSSAVGSAKDSAIPLRTQGTQAPLFFVHDGLGSVVYTHMLLPYLDLDHPVYCLPLDPLGTAHLQSMQAMASRMVRLIREVQPEGPYWLVGWSFGGTLAYEICAQLIREQHTIAYLGMLDTHYAANNSAFLDETKPEEQRYKEILLLYASYEMNSDEIAMKKIEKLAEVIEEHSFGELIGLCQEHGLLPIELTENELMEKVSSIHALALSNYRYQAAPIPIPVDLFPAIDQPGPLSRGWERVIPSEFLRISTVPGTHHSMLRAPNIQVLAQELKRTIQPDLAKTRVLVEAEELMLTT